MGPIGPILPSLLTPPCPPGLLKTVVRISYMAKLGILTMAALTLNSCVDRKAADFLTLPRRAGHGDYWVTRAGITPRAFVVVAADGTRLECLETSAAPGLRKRGTVYLFHGLGNTKEQMLPTAKRLSAAGFRCIAWDSRGHGKSGGTRASYGAREVGDALEVIAEARKRDGEKSRRKAGGDERVWAYSMGTAVALQALPYLPEVKAAVLLAPIADLGGVMSHQAAVHYHGLLRPLVPVVRARIRSTAGFDPKAIRPVDAVRATRARMLLIHGADDEVIPLTQAEKILAAGAPGQVRLIVLEGFRHQAVMWDLPEETREKAVLFLSTKS